MLESRRVVSFLRPVAALLVLLACTSAAYAFIPPGSFVVQRCVKRLHSLRGLEVVLEVHDGADLYIERIIIPRKGRLRYPAERERPGVETLRQILRADVVGLAQSLAIDVSRTSLVRFDDRVAIRLGASEADDGLPQLWVDQDSFFPVRLSAGVRVMEFRGIHSLTTRGWFPREIVVSERGATVWTAQVVRIKLLP